MSADRPTGGGRIGFTKTSAPEERTRPSLSSEQRTTLIRKGNELFNNGDYETARRIFVTVGYTDGLIRLGDLYYKQNKPLAAFQMYRLAPDSAKTARMIERMALVLRTWLLEDEAREQRARDQQTKKERAHKQ